jgi:UrcA family protein
MTRFIQTSTRACAVAASLLSLALSAAAVPAMAASQDSDTAVVSIKVSYADLDVSSRAGAATLLARINAAATQACGGAPDRLNLSQSSIYDYCKARAVTAAIDTVHAPQVSALAHRPTASVVMAGR